MRNLLNDNFSVPHCNDPGSIQNGEMDGNPPFTCVSSVQYACSEGYWLLGADFLKCGINGGWDNAKPACIDKSKQQRNFAINLKPFLNIVPSFS